MRIIPIILPTPLLILLLTSCFNNRWTEEERKAFATKCSCTDTIRNEIFAFRGFENNELDTIQVLEFKDSILLDSFHVIVEPARNAYDLERKERSATIDHLLNIKYKYHFILSDEKPYVLENMKMVMWPQYTQKSEGWGCRMGDYTIDGVRFEHNANPTFIKRDTIQLR